MSETETIHIDDRDNYCLVFIDMPKHLVSSESVKGEGPTKDDAINMAINKLYMLKDNISHQIEALQLAKASGK